jgi:hypothetical protein
MTARPGWFPNGNPKPDYEGHLEPAIVEDLPTLVGKDPRKMTVAELNGLGHVKQPLLGHSPGMHPVLRRQ